MANPIIEHQPADENELQSVLADVFRSAGWTAIREYTPDHSQKRVDLYAEHGEYGTLGVETKHIRSDRDGGRLAEAYLQVTRDYWQRQYNQEKILLWAVAPYFAPGGLTGAIDDNRIRDFVQEFITATGVGFLDCHADTLTVRYSPTDLSKTIPIAGPYADTYAERLDIEALAEHVRDRRQIRDNRL